MANGIKPAPVIGSGNLNLVQLRAVARNLMYRKMRWRERSVAAGSPKRKTLRLNCIFNR
jgi:hypothetical protein